MDWENQTLQYYEQNADGFISGTLTANMEDMRNHFTSHLPPHACILDFGCGSGRDTKAFLDSGYRVDAMDGSEEMCAKASIYTGIQVKRMLFNELNAHEMYDGIWACASILHLPKTKLIDVLKRIEGALKSGGVLYTSFKYGDFEGIRNGRFFTDFTEESLNAFWKTATTMEITDISISSDVRPGRKEEKWINLLARRV